ncbi:MAG TPA: prolyl oligopeptidase family serine peptidase [Kofleriaceae bacterium]|nr:prolyl oligopeptidase family serine peptidase [Kofleriaceae bacterium]
MFRRASLIATLVLLAPLAARAQTTYQEAPAGLREVVRAPRTPLTYVSPDGQQLAIARPASYPPIAELAAPMLALAGVRINPRTNGFHGWSHFEGTYTLRRLPDGKDVTVRLPAGMAFGAPFWSPDSSAFAFANIAAGSIELWVVDVATARARKVPGVALNPLLGDWLTWMPDGHTLLVKTVPPKRGPAPVERPPVGPDVRDSAGTTRASSTYEARDLLRTPHDAALFTHYATAQLAAIDRRSLKVRRFGAAGVLGHVEAAPGGQHLLVESIRQPYSFTRAWQRFARDVEVWSLDGKVVEQVARLPVADQVPIDGVETGPRDVGFVATAPATLHWVEALDQGDWAVKAARRDRLILKEVGKPARTWLDLEQRYSGIDWVEGGQVALVSEWERDRRWTRTFLVPVDGGGAPRTLWDRSLNDLYGDPGSPHYRVLPSGVWVVRRDGDAIFLTGSGATPDGNRPFLDRLDLTTLKTTRLFRADRTTLESFVAWHDVAAGTFFTRRQSPADPPNLALRTLGAPVARPAGGEAGRTSEVRMLTSFPDPMPQVRGVTKRLVTLTRPDGVKLSFTLYLPPGYKAGTRLPTVFYAYPTEYSDAGTAGQVAAAPNAFTAPYGASIVLFALAGYAVIDVAMPVVGPPETVYDTFVEQIVANAKAAIGAAVKEGVTDPDRVGVMGHSHGGLMTANLLAYSDLFRAGIARSGAYNHTLRPFGFQNEHRTLFQARDTYYKLSPLLNADRIDEPLLIIHGAIDANPGTVPLQSEKLFEAVRGVGGVTRLVMLPFESHGYAARESIEHVVAEQLAWFDRYVKDAPPRGRKPARKP